MQVNSPAQKDTAMKLLKTTLVAGVALMASAAAMATSTFDLSQNLPATGACSQNGSNSGMGNTYDCSAGSPGYGTELTISAYSSTGAGQTFAAARLGDYNSSGFGVSGNGETTTSPQHSMDNNGALDLILFKFDSSIALSSIQAGWFDGDSDMSVLAYTGNGNAVAELTGASQSTLLSTGWSLIGSYADSGTSQRAINSGAVSSSYWIVSAYSSSFGGETPGGAFGQGNDYIKLKAVKGNFTCVNSNDPSCAPPSTSVPEPTSLALAGIALLGVVGSRRRAKKVVAG
jgi:hypothetical protein